MTEYQGSASFFQFELLFLECSVAKDSQSSTKCADSASSSQFERYTKDLQTLCFLKVFISRLWLSKDSLLTNCIFYRGYLLPLWHSKRILSYSQRSSCITNPLGQHKRWTDLKFFLRSLHLSGQSKS